MSARIITIKTVVFLSLLLAGLSSEGCFANGKIYIEDDSRILRAYELICDHKLRIAKNYVSNLLRHNKDNIHLLNVRSYIEVYLSEYKQAEADCNKVLAQDPENIGSLARRSFARLNQGNYKGGIEDLNKLLAQVPDDYPNLLNRSKAYSKLGNKTLATRDYQLACKYVLVTDVSLVTDKEKLLKSLKDINDRMEDGKKHPFLFLARAKCFYRLKKYDNAIRDAGAAMIADKSVSVRARYIRSRVYLRQGKAENAIRDLTYVINQKPKIVDWGYFAMCPGHLDMKRWRRRIVRLDDAFVDRARAYSKQMNYKLAVDDCNKALKLNNTNIDALLIRASAYEAQKDYPKASGDYTTAVKLSNGRQDTIYMLSRSLKRINQISAGRTDLLVSLTGSLQDLGRHKEALTTLTKLLKTNPKNKSVYKAKIRSLLALKRYWSAVEDADKLISLDKNDPDGFIFKGDAETKLKEYRNAIDNYTEALKKGGGTKARKKRALVYKKIGKNDLYDREMRIIGKEN